MTRSSLLLNGWPFIPRSRPKYSRFSWTVSLGIEADVVEECSDILLHLRRSSFSCFIVNRDRSRLRLQYSTNGAQRRCFSSAVCPEQACNCAIWGFE